ncbi:psbQ-like protein 3, chloroplastic [Cannabis sativa]|uniref:PsbQ-like protein 3, chloroplastic n=1 Tax=Cannabis sativa TaxID=3483 RepID=A0A7J6DQX2_CANSA|nr:psbQ-like protein 3, chloroplastic [Cannabis sativa]KAF4348200.1 hypothetical protein G4B88_001186 [Cannabis sativa]
MKMAVKPLPLPLPLFNCCSSCCSKPATSVGVNLSKASGRRGIVMVGITIIVGSLGFNCGQKLANGLEMGMVSPDQTVEEAQKGIRGHVVALLKVKDLIDSHSWSEAQKALRKTSAYVKLDLYTIIQASPPTQRSLLRKLYFQLSNNVSNLDYAARDKDAIRVLKCYDNIVVAVNDILSTISSI